MKLNETNSHATILFKGIYFFFGFKIITFGIEKMVSKLVKSLSIKLNFSIKLFFY